MSDEGLARSRFDLDSSAGFWLGIAYRKVSTLLLHRIADFDVTPEQWSVLYRIGEQDGQIQKDIAERSGKDKPTTTRILDALEAKGFIEKRPGENDRRSFRIFLTEKGKKARERIAPIEYDTIRDATAGMTAEEYAMLLRMLRRISDNADGLLSELKKE